MNFLGLGTKLQPIHIHWILYLNDLEKYHKTRWPSLIPFAEIALYSREKTLEQAKAKGYFKYWEVRDLVRIIEDADTSR